MGNGKFNFISNFRDFRQREREGLKDEQRNEFFNDDGSDFLINSVARQIFLQAQLNYARWNFCVYLCWLGDKTEKENFIRRGNVMNIEPRRNLSNPRLLLLFNNKAMVFMNLPLKAQREITPPKGN